MLASLHHYIENKWLSMKTLFSGVVIGSLMLCSTQVLSQNSEIGMEVGVNNYMGDLVRGYDLGNHALGAQFFWRKHLNDAFSIRLSAGVGKLKGQDDQAFDVFSANRSASFESSFQNVDFHFEYHFLDYRNEKLQQYWTPYLLFGFGLYNMDGEDNFGNSYDTGISFRLPVGVGIKYRLDRRWTLGVSTSVIKTFSDDLDNVSLSNQAIKNYRGGNPNNDDVMFYTSISLSYTFYRIVCPTSPFR